MNGGVPLSRCIMYMSTGCRIVGIQESPYDEYYIIEQPNGKLYKRNCSYIHKQYKVVCKKIYKKVSSDTWRVEKDGIVEDVKVKRGDIISYDHHDRPFIVVERNSPCWTGICSKNGKKEIFFVRINKTSPHHNRKIFKSLFW